MLSPRRVLSLPIFHRRLIHDLPTTNLLRRHRIQQEVLGTGHRPGPDDPKPWLALASELETLKSQMARESGVEELRQMYTDLYEPLTVQVKDSAELKRVVVGVVGELRGRVEKLEGSVGEELKARVEVLEGTIEKLQIQGGRCGWVEEGRKKRSGWLTFALFSSSALFCADIALRLVETPGKKVVVDGKAFTS